MENVGNAFIETTARVPGDEFVGLTLMMKLIEVPASVFGVVEKAEVGWLTLVDGMNSSRTENQAQG